MKIRFFYCEAKDPDEVVDLQNRLNAFFATKGNKIRDCRSRVYNDGEDDILFFYVTYEEKAA